MTRIKVPYPLLIERHPGEVSKIVDTIRDSKSQMRKLQPEEMEWEYAYRIQNTFHQGKGLIRMIVTGELEREMKAEQRFMDSASIEEKTKIRIERTIAGIVARHPSKSHTREFSEVIQSPPMEVINDIKGKVILMEMERAEKERSPAKKKAIINDLMRYKGEFKMGTSH